MNFPMANYVSEPVESSEGFDIKEFEMHHTGKKLRIKLKIKNTFFRFGQVGALKLLVEDAKS